MLLLPAAFAASFSWITEAEFAAGTAAGLDDAGGALAVVPAADWFDSAWAYRVPIAVRERAGVSTSDYTLLLAIDTSSLVSGGYLDAAGADLRLVDDTGGGLDHWLEGGLGTASTELWVQLPSVSASTTATVYLYGGNAAATSTSSHGATFLWWDDFATDTIASYTRRGLDGSPADSWTVSGGYLGVTAASGYSAALVTSVAVSDHYEVEAPAYSDDDDGLGIVGNVNAAGTSYYRATGWASGPTVTGIAGGDTFAASSVTISAGRTYVYTFRKSGTRLEMLLDGASVAVGTDTSPSTETGLGVWSYRNSPGAYFASLQVRRYTYPEPEATLGTVEGPYSQTGTWTSPVVDTACLDSAWDRITWSEVVPVGASVEVAVRSGPSASPDASWGAWTTVVSGGDPGLVGQYAQVRVTLTGSVAGTPTVENLQLDATPAGDADGDGHDDLACGGVDCDDTDPTVSPTAGEACDGVDQDCDGLVDEGVGTVSYPDGDADGYGDDLGGATACEVPTGWTATGGDCDDADAAVFPGAVERCNGLDDDCDGTVDPPTADGAPTWYTDADGDGYGSASAGAGCTAPDGAVAVGGDCDDDDPAAHPGAPETWYDGVDADCAGDDDYDADADGQASHTYGGPDCDDGDPAVYDGAKETWYDGVDADCAGDDDYDADRDGQASQTYGGEDCDDADPAVYTGAPDAPYDGIRTDCASASDYDADGDGYDSDDWGGDDCDDARSDTYPGAAEQWYDGVDQDCDGNDADQDGDGVILTYDCDDEDAAVSPNADEVDGNGVDDDCDGVVDLETGETGDTGEGGETGEAKDGACGCTGAAAPGALGALVGAVLLRRRRILAVARPTPG